MQIPGQIPGNLADFGRGVLFRPGPGPRSILVTLFISYINNISYISYTSYINYTSY